MQGYSLGECRDSDAAEKDTQGIVGWPYCLKILALGHVRPWHDRIYIEYWLPGNNSGAKYSGLLFTPKQHPSWMLLANVLHALDTL